MTTPFKNDYALGLAVARERHDPHRARRRHRGIQHGARVQSGRARIVVAVLANVNGPAADNLVLSLMSAARGEAITALKDDAGAVMERK